MYARTSIIQADPAKIEDGITTVREEVLPTVSEMDGCVGMSMLVDRQSGRCIATTAWQTEEAMRASREQVRPLRDQAERTLGGSGSDVHEWEVAVVHRDHAVPDGACARVTWLSGGRDNAERATDMFKMAVLPRVQEFAGFCSASLLIDRETERVVGTVIYDSRETLEASRDATARIRERVIQELGATLDGVEELEMAFAHLHVPEMA